MKKVNALAVMVVVRGINGDFLYQLKSSATPNNTGLILTNFPQKRERI
jgi:hypothetical protein